jgi:hypothetical protein
MGTLRIRAETPLDLAPPTYLGPSRAFKVLASVLLVGPDEAEAARWVDHQWAINGKRFTRLLVDERATITFLGVSTAIPPIGPFQEIRMADGSVFGDEVLLARFDERDTWITTTNLKCLGFTLNSYTEGPAED